MKYRLLTLTLLILGLPMADTAQRHFHVISEGGNLNETPWITSSIETAQGDDVVGLKLGGTDLCEVETLGVHLASARFYGHKSDLLKLFGGAFSGAHGLKCRRCAGSCECALEGPDCFLRKAPKAEMTGAGAPPPPPGTVLVIIDEPGDGGSRGSESKSPMDPLLEIYRTGKDDSGCTTELCANSKGEVSVSAKCGDVKLKISSSGKATMSASSGKLTLTLP